MAFIDVIDYQEAEGRLKEIYDDLIQRRGKLAAVHTMQSLNPETIVQHMDLYIEIMFGRSPLKRAQREMIAVVVSCANECEYCQTHHAEALNHFWKDDDRTNALKADYTNVELSETDRALCEMAWNLTKTAKWDGQEAQTGLLRSLGLNDRAILDAMLVISYFNFVNRMVLGLGVHLEEHQGVGFNYD